MSAVCLSEGGAEATKPTAYCDVDASHPEQGSGSLGGLHSTEKSACDELVDPFVGPVFPQKQRRSRGLDLRIALATLSRVSVKSGIFNLNDTKAKCAPMNRAAPILLSIR